MSARTHQSSPVTVAFHTAALAAWDLTGDGTIPLHIPMGGQDSKLPLRAYGIVYQLPGAGFNGSLSADDLDADADQLIQITCIGGTARAAADLRDLYRRALSGTWLTVTGRSAGPVQLDLELGVREDTKVTPHLFYAIDQYRIPSTPA